MPPNWRPLTIGTSTVIALPSNRDRLELAINNNSSNYVEWEHSPYLTYGIGGRILPGQTVILTETDGDLVHEPVFVVASGAATNIRLYEVTGATVSWKRLLELR